MFHVDMAEDDTETKSDSKGETAESTAEPEPKKE